MLEQRQENLGLIHEIEVQPSAWNFEGGMANCSIKADPKTGNPLLLKRYKDDAEGGSLLDAVSIRRQHPDIPADELSYPYAYDIPSPMAQRFNGRKKRKIVTNFKPGTTTEEVIYLLMEMGDTSPPCIITNCVRKLIFKTQQILDKLAKKGIVHRDIKPSNIVIQSTQDRTTDIADSQTAAFKAATSSRDFHVGLIDIDMLALETQMKIEHQLGIYELRGSPTFFAPEIILGHATPASDRFALGLTAAAFFPKIIGKLGLNLAPPQAEDVLDTTGFLGERLHTKSTSCPHTQSGIRQAMMRDPWVPGNYGLGEYFIRALHPDPNARPRNTEEVRQILDYTGNIAQI